MFCIMLTKDEIVNALRCEGIMKEEAEFVAETLKKYYFSLLEKNGDIGINAVGTRCILDDRFIYMEPKKGELVKNKLASNISDIIRDRMIIFEQPCSHTEKMYTTRFDIRFYCQGEQSEKLYLKGD